MNLVKRMGHCLFPTKFEHESHDMAFREAQRLASLSQIGEVYVVYRPTHIVMKNRHGSLVSLPVDQDGKMTVGDAMQAGF